MCAHSHRSRGEHALCAPAIFTAQRARAESTRSATRRSSPNSACCFAPRRASRTTRARRHRDSLRGRARAALEAACAAARALLRREAALRRRARAALEARRGAKLSGQHALCGTELHRAACARAARALRSFQGSTRSPAQSRAACCASSAAWSSATPLDGARRRRVACGSPVAAAPGTRPPARAPGGKLASYPWQSAPLVGGVSDVLSPGAILAGGRTQDKSSPCGFDITIFGTV